MPQILEWKNASIVLYIIFLLTRVFLVTLQFKRVLQQIKIVTVNVWQVHTERWVIQQATASHVLKEHIVMIQPTNARYAHLVNMRALNRHLASFANLESFKKTHKNHIVIRVT